jgi:Inner membrane component of T3SS, cytoplasmic domain
VDPEDGEGKPADGGVSDAEWDALVGELSGPSEARGTQDSFAVPIDDELRASAQAELGRLAGEDADNVGTIGYGEVADPGAEPPTELTETGLVGSTVVRAAAGWWQRVQAAVERRRRRPPAALALPSGSQARFTIGREAHCDMTLLDRTVSRLHASLKREGEGWLLTDLGSTNGTRLNGWRVTTPITVVAGDRVSFGAATFVLTDQPR